ncbi:MAG: AAA family ATPase [Thiothrix sp.]|uniref:AAA family ATPase n=1 Tax=Thiothrix sp. TaxID=1032 RepID=UPI002625C98F|nr:AAA family ATPase [Thiothrix sp.]MDD5391642.1 AAA family ATPase [Thiothrix sp.]
MLKKILLVLLLNLLFPLTYASLIDDNTSPSRPEENPKPILDAPSLRIPAAPAYHTTLKELGYKDVDDLLKQTLQAQSRVNSVAFDGGGQLASGSSDGTVKLWDVKNGELKQTLQAQSRVNSVAFDGGGQLASGSYDGTVKLWDVKSGALKQTLQAQSGVSSVAFDGRGQLASGSYDGTVKLWDVKSGALKQTLQAGGSGYSPVVVAFDGGGQLASYSSDGRVKLWDVKSGELKQTLQAQSGVLSVAFDGGGQLASGSSDGTVELWDVKSGELKQTLQAQSRVNSVAFDGGGQLVTGSSDGTVKLWDVKSGALKQTLQAHTDWVRSVAFDGGGQLASGSDDGTVKLWDVKSGALKQTLQTGSLVWSVAFDRKGLLASGLDDGLVKLWDVETGELKKTLEAKSRVLSVAFDGTGILASGTDDATGVVEVWDVESGRRKYLLEDGGLVGGLVFDGKGSLANSSTDGRIRLWDVKTGLLKHVLPVYEGDIARLGGSVPIVFDNMGQLISGSDGSAINLWDVNTGSLKKSFQTHHERVVSLGFDGNGHLASSGFDGIVGIWNIQNSELLNVLITNIRGDNWVTISNDGSLLRADTDSLYLPVPDSSSVTWSLQLDSGSVDLQAGKDGEAATFTLSLTNTGSQPVHRPHILPMADADGVLQVIPANPEPTYPQTEAIYSSTSLIPPGQTIKLAARIIPATDNPAKSGQYTLPIKVAVSGGASKQADLVVNLKTPDVAVTGSDFSSDTNTLSIQLKNQGTADLPKTDFYLTDPQGELDLPRQSLETIRAQTDAPPLAFTLPKDISREQRDRLQLEIRPMRPPLYTQWRVPLEINAMPAHLQILLVLVSLGLLGFTAFYFRRYRHPLVLELGAQPQALYRLSLEQLPEAHQRLQQTGRLNSVLDTAEVSHDSFKHALDFQQASAEQKAQWLAMRLGGQLTNGGNGIASEAGSYEAPLTPPFAKGGLGGIFSLKLPPTFPLNVDRLLLYFPAVDAQDVFTHLQAIPQAEGRITLIIGADSAYQRKLLTTTMDLSNKYVAPQSKQITELLLSPHAETALAKIMSEQLSLKQISPYQIGGGVNKEALFFGRRELISQIVNRDPANYLLVGGRQMGKSTLLKALERRYADNPQVQCHYHTLSNEVMVPRLARALQLPDTDSAETFAAVLEQRIRDTGQRYIFLIDEADRFIEHEQAQGYPILNVFRRLSEQGNCSFILAGFWQLYQHAVLDYQSPLRNFGEVLEVGALERDACIQLAILPMQTMSLGYASDAIVQNMVQACGQRANLIAYVCHQLIQNLPAQQRTITAGDIHQVLSSRDMGKRFEGWSVGNNEQEQRYDRLVVYSTIGKEGFSTGELIKQLEEQNLVFDAAELERTLSRLELAFILTRESNRWRYRIPLFVEYMQADDPDVKLATLLKQW